MCSRAFGAFHNRRAVGVLCFGRAWMSEDTAQGQESESQNARGLSFFQTRIHTDSHRFELVRELVQGFACRSAHSTIGARPAIYALSGRGPAQLKAQ